MYARLSACSSFCVGYQISFILLHGPCKRKKNVYCKEKQGFCCRDKLCVTKRESLCRVMPDYDIKATK